jgi:ankyrin repeat protein
MFKKTAVILFLLSQIMTVSASGNKSKPKSFKKIGAVKTTRVSPLIVRPNSPKTTTMRLRSRRSPLGMSELSSSSVSSSNSSVNSSIDGLDGGVELVHFVDEKELDSFNFDLMGLNGEGPPKGKQVIDSLLEAIENGDLNSVRILITQEVDLNSFEKGERTPFMLAIQAHNHEMIDAMLSTGNVDPNIISSDNCDVLSWAAFHSGFELVEKIIGGSIKLSPLSTFTILSNLKRNQSPIFNQMIAAMVRTRYLPVISTLILMAKDAVIANDIDLVTIMHTAGVPLNKNYRGVYFIHYAAAHGFLEMVNLLIECGTPVDILTHRTQASALKISYASKECAVSAELIKKGAKHELMDCIFDSILNNKISIIKALLSTYTDLTGKINFESGFNPITLAISADKPEILQLILESGAINPLMTDINDFSIYNMDINENASQELKLIVQQERDCANYLIESLED